MSAFIKTEPFASEAFRETGISKKDAADLDWIVKRLSKVHGLILSSEFKRKLIEDTLNKSSDVEGWNDEWNEWEKKPKKKFDMSASALDSTVEQCSKWRKYLQNPDDFEVLLQTALSSMMKCKTTVLSTYFCEKDGLKLKDLKPAPSYAIIIDCNGIVKEIR